MPFIRATDFYPRMPSSPRPWARPGLVWIGPAPQSIRDMGDKQRAREIAIAASVAVVPGSRRFEAGKLDGVDDAGDAVGYPLLVKAAAGGGGIGMRRVDKPDQLKEVAAATQSMAGKAFGDGAVFLERFIPKARHIEIQVFGYGDGKAIHLFERDCSLQRRYQKIIEESPAPQVCRAPCATAWPPPRSRSAAPRTIAAPER